MKFYSGPHFFRGGFYHLLEDRGEPYGLQVRMPGLAARLTFLEDEGFTVVLLSPCCGQKLDAWPKIRDPRSGRELSPSKREPYLCSECGTRASLPGIIDTWWECGSIGSLADRLAYYLETWEEAGVLEAPLRAVELAELLYAFAAPVASLRGAASLWPRRG